MNMDVVTSARQMVIVPFAMNVFSKMVTNNVFPKIVHVTQMVDVVQKVNVLSV
jgi:hypothetical protein